jgi:hypothetical protein
MASRIVLAVLAVLVIGAAVFLATWEIPAPTRTIEKTIPSDRFPS